MPLIFVPTPLGNLRDVTLRAIDVLRQAEIVVAEDTRVARKLLRALEIEVRETLELSRTERRARDAGNSRTSAHRDRRRYHRCRDAGGLGSGKRSRRGGASRRRTDRRSAGPLRRHERRALVGFFAAAFRVRGISAARRLGAARAVCRRIAVERHFDLVRIAATDSRYSRRSRRSSRRRAGFRRPGIYQASRNSIIGELRECVAAQIPDPPRGEVAFAIAPYRVATVVRDRHEEVSDAIDALLESGQRVGDVAKELAAHGFGDRRQLYAAAAARKAAQKTPLKQQ